MLMCKYFDFDVHSKKGSFLLAAAVVFEEDFHGKLIFQTFCKFFAF